MVRGDDDPAAVHPGVPQEPLPYIHFLPAENFTAPKEDYQCPLYRTNVRAGVLGTTVSSTGVMCASRRLVGLL